MDHYPLATYCKHGSPRNGSWNCSSSSGILWDNYNMLRGFLQVNKSHLASLATGKMLTVSTVVTCELQPWRGGGPRLPPVCAGLCAQKLRCHASPPSGRSLSQTTTTTTTENLKCGCGEVGTFVLYLCEYKMVPWLWKTVSGSQKIKDRITILGSTTVRTENRISKGYWHTHVYSSVNNSQETEATQMSFKGRMNKQKVVYRDHGCYSVVNKEGNPVSCYNMNEPWGH